MGSINRPFVESVINTYFEMGTAALERREYAIALKMFKAVFEEPSSKAQKEKIMLLLLIRSAQAHEGLKQLYKAKLLYIRALSVQRKACAEPNMQTVEILLTLANLTTQQGLYRQAVDFAAEAHESYNRCPAQEPLAFVRNLRRTERVMQLKGRQVEQQKLLRMLQSVKTEALMTIPGMASVMPAAFAVPV
jgi:tetratricopeptide (TPR) repeat protein